MTKCLEEISNHTSAHPYTLHGVANMFPRVFTCSMTCSCAARAEGPEARWPAGTPTRGSRPAARSATRPPHHTLRTRSHTRQVDSRVATPCGQRRNEWTVKRDRGPSPGARERYQTPTDAPLQYRDPSLRENQRPETRAKLRREQLLACSLGFGHVVNISTTTASRSCMRPTRQEIDPASFPYPLPFRRRSVARP